MTESKNKNSKYSVLTKNMALFTISSFGSKLISFLLVPLYTYILNTREFGTVDLLTSTASLLIPVLTVNIQDAILRFTLEKDYNARDIISTGVRVNIIGCVVLAMGLFILKAGGILHLDFPMTAFLFLSYSLGALNNCFTLYLKGREKISVLVVSGVLSTIIMCSLNIFLLLVVKVGVLGYLIANIAGVSAAVVYTFFVGGIYKDIRLRKYQNLSKDMMNYSRPLVANSLAWWINNASDRYILTLMCGLSANGVYSVAYKVPTILSTIQSIFYNAWSISAITEFDPEDKDGFIGNTYSAYSLISILSCSVIMLLNIPLAHILYSKDFFAAWKYIPFLLAGTVFNGIALFQGCLFTAVKNTKDVSKTTIAGACVNTICNFIFIYFFGALGAALATLLGYTVTWIIRTLKLTKIIQMKVNWKCHISSCLLLIIQSFCALNKDAWLMQVGIIILILIIQRKYVGAILTKVKKLLLC